MLRTALEAELSSKPFDYRFTASELGAIDQLHTRGYPATVELANAAGITPGARVLDLGSGLGGPARYLAETYGCRVDGIDTTTGLVNAANYLSTRWAGPAGNVTFAVGDALATPFTDASFDLVWMQHVAMNIADRDRLYGEIQRVLRSGGRFATYDVLQAQSELLYPTPWARDASVSTVLTAQATREALERAGMHVISFELDTPAALAWARTSAAALLKSEPPPGASMMRAALGENFREVIGNLGKNYLEGRADVAFIIAQKIAQKDEA
jgi:sarcosine/dimethylglycine N-methyltransferase